MKITIKRTTKRAGYTIGRLYIDGEYFCDTIEDRDRGLVSTMPLDEVKSIKVYGETAIPAGEYRLLLTPSVKFQNRQWAKNWGGIVPLVDNVTGFTGIRIHPANSASELLGCIAVGKASGASVINSAQTYARLMERLTKANEEIMLQII